MQETDDRGNLVPPGEPQPFNRHERRKQAVLRKREETKKRQKRNKRK